MKWRLKRAGRWLASIARKRMRRHGPGMRFIPMLASLLVLASCATAPASSPAAPEPPQAQPGRIAALLAQAGRVDAPTHEAVVRALGEADIARQDGVGMALTYRLPTCALLLLFAADANNAMRLRETHAGARRAGEAAPSLDQCAAEAGARRP
jgi:hypothetical protein